MSRFLDLINGKPENPTPVTAPTPVAAPAVTPDIKVAVKKPNEKT
jgi:hypothetical protein